MKRNLTSIADLSREEVYHLISLGRRLKAELAARKPHAWLAGRTLALIFEKPSLRTRVTFETGMYQLGGDTIYLGPSDIQLGKREPVKDIAANLALWVDGIMARTFDHAAILELAAHAKVPVINGLSDLYHPCQVLADCMTLAERTDDLSSLKIVYVGDGYEPEHDIVETARKGAGARITVTHDVAEGTRGANVLYTDVWTSMGQEAEAERRRKAFRPYQINSEVLAGAARDAIVMHCLPAHRGEEITAEVVDGERSIILAQAENRLHIQKAIVAWLLGADEAQA
jgi:ornithine carbamoyltransferase